ncbi:MAG TPA: septal ring lytic transglycosylase RlpA family protein [Abditibacterium sp.]|jgi:rare lipoprotein A
MIKSSFSVVALTTFSLVALGASGAQAQTRSGRAAYHLSSRSLTTCARYEAVGSVLRVTNPQTGKTILVKVTGRGPYNGNRILDLSTGSFKALYGGLGRGVGPVRYSVVKRAKG